MWNKLSILKELYDENLIYVKLSDGLTQPFKSNSGVKQGCVLSPLCFNLFINKLCSVYVNEHGKSNFSDPVYIQNTPLNCLMWADDCVVMSQSSTGLQNAINSKANFFKNLGLPVNISNISKTAYYSSKPPSLLFK